METHWDRTWRRFSEAFEKQRRRDMNDTTRDELTDYVADELNFVNSEGMYSEASIRTRAERVVARITAARDAEIREALLSDGAIDNAAAERDWAGCEFSAPIDRSRWLHLNESIKEWERVQARATIEAAFDAIGLAEEGAE